MSEDLVLLAMCGIIVTGIVAVIISYHYFQTKIYLSVQKGKADE